ncbi:hypothetical protein FNYG_13590 [Fusarium nygamai]|uniref:Uncharacterized protein n=1 Tax=Gibberella nygamai TaxID=42673 RepID=A0A2K0UV62_GIBNY|nr:hypothetical protein FNYG_13590 [Fusarium nygamai]
MDATVRLALNVQRICRREEWSLFEDRREEGQDTTRPYEAASLVHKVVRSLIKDNYALRLLKKMILSAGFYAMKSSAMYQLTRKCKLSCAQRSRASQGSRTIRKEVDYAFRGASPGLEDKVGSPYRLGACKCCDPREY